MFNEDEEKKLIAGISQELPRLEDLLKQANDKWVYEDGVYRFYHQSLKVFYLQESTVQIVAALRGLAPHLELNQWFMDIVSQGTNKEFDPIRSNTHWLAEARPILEAFFHARHFLEMVCKYGKTIKEPPQVMSSGWAAILYLYNIR
jgi:hypothetical protein